MIDQIWKYHNVVIRLDFQLYYKIIGKYINLVKIKMNCYLNNYFKYNEKLPRNNTNIYT